MSGDAGHGTERSPAGDLVAALRAHRPRDAREARSVRRGLGLLAWLRAPLDETADPTHVTGSAVVLDEHGRVLLHRHKRLGIWLQPGGHVDPGERPHEAARRETAEETGLDARHPADGPTLVHVDLHEGPRGHVHLDLRYLLHGSARAELAPAPGESPDVAWCTPEEVARRSDASMVSAVAAALTRSRGGPALDAALTRSRGGPR